MLRILHTSDWHLGRKLKDHDRADEFRKFLTWLEGVIAKQKPDALIVSGDIFNTSNPPVESQEMYYSFLSRVAGKTCPNIIITAGNHDSAPFIDAPAGLMERCSVHVIGRACSDEAILLNDKQGRPGMIVCAVPFLHDYDVRTGKSEASFADIEREIKTGIMSHYAEVFVKARELRGDMDIPIVAAGHLFLDAGKTNDSEGERSLYLGTAIKVGADIFPDDAAYVALGHLHSPQKVGRDNVRYSGSPIALTFGEWGTQKTVSVVDFAGRNFAGVTEIRVPVWREMARVSGDMAGIERELRELAGRNVSVWAEVTYTGAESPGDLAGRLADITEGSLVEVLSVRNEREYESYGGGNKPGSVITIKDMKPREMLELYFEEKDIPTADREIFVELYKEILREMEIDY
ncbi:MAG: exonuclease SbcCD subunit D C-terminal domain-containing protein [Synergistaceae bacterium]|nr:exonuclease SbcCD subunit D C-terminal domain-containing protein [Synergistaceae bacterium]